MADSDAPRKFVGNACKCIYATGARLLARVLNCAWRLAVGSATLAAGSSLSPPPNHFRFRIRPAAASDRPCPGSICDAGRTPRARPEYSSTRGSPPGGPRHIAPQAQSRRLHGRGDRRRLGRCVHRGSSSAVARGQGAPHTVRALQYRLWVFHGPHQNKFDAALVNACQPLNAVVPVSARHRPRVRSTSS